MQPLTYERMMERARRARNLAEKVRRSRERRADATATAAGIAPHHMGTAGHNALLDYRNGKPWKNVDYPKLRLAFHQYRQAGDAERLGRSLWARLYEQWRAGGFAYEPRP